MNSQVVVITGGGQGLGAATAASMVRRQCVVAIADIDGEKAHSTAASCNARGANHFAIQVDLGQPDGPQGLIDAVLDKAGRLDVLINCAALSPIEAFLEMSAAAWEKTLLVNVRAVALSMAAAGRAMAKQRSGHIVNVTSTAARMAVPNFAAYSATKAAVDSLTRSGAVALAPHGIRVNGFSPGMMDTAMQESIEEKFCALDGRTDLAAYKAERTARVPLQRRTTPEEMAESLTWLALDSPPYMTAERFNVTGGLDKD
jgi:3-oxoacyl-[acyl-carrier protein] reductase